MTFSADPARGLERVWHSHPHQKGCRRAGGHQRPASPSRDACAVGFPRRCRRCDRQRSSEACPWPRHDEADRTALFLQPARAKIATTNIVVQRVSSPSATSPQKYATMLPRGRDGSASGVVALGASCAVKTLAVSSCSCRAGTSSPWWRDARWWRRNMKPFRSRPTADMRRAQVDECACTRPDSASCRGRFRRLT